MAIAEQIRAFIHSDLASDRKDLTLGPDDDLVELGIVDSMGILTLASFLEKTYDVRIDELEMVPDNFASLAKIERYLLSKGAADPANQE